MKTKLLRMHSFNSAIFILVTSISIMSPLAFAEAGSTRYVSVSGNDNGDCNSALSPCRAIQYAVNQSISGDRILVSEGTYTYSATEDRCSSQNNVKPPSVLCFVDKDLSILGGYSISDWSTAKPALNLTVIDGQSTYRGVTAIGYNTTTAHLTMEGFTIQNGRAQGPTSYDTSGIGGGMLAQHASVILKDLTFKNNRAIGADTVSGAGGPADGGALRIEWAPEGTSSLLQRVVFDNNQSFGGTGPDRGGVAFGALFIYRSTVTIEDAIFTNNLAHGGNSMGNGTSGGLQADALGGAIGIEQGYTITVKRATLAGNQIRGGNATLYGGGAYGAGILIEDTNSFTISDSLIENNIAVAGDAHTGGNTGGGSIHAANNTMVALERVKVTWNSAIGGNSISGGYAGPGAGGGMYIFATRPGTFNAAIKNVIIADNSADKGSGSISPENGGGGGGGVVIHGLTADFIHTTIARNRIGTALVLGQGMLVLPWALQLGSLPAAVTLQKSIITDHTEGGVLTSAITVQQGSSLTFNRGLFAANRKNTNNDGSPVPAGEINGLSSMLSASSAGYISPGPPNYNYHLRLDSAAKDQATGSTATEDFENQTRPYNGISDLGADEYRPFPLMVTRGDGTLRLNWAAGINMLLGGVQLYTVLVECGAGASPPREGNCGQPIPIGNTTNFTLTGLTNHKPYTLTINSFGSANNLLAQSIVVTAAPTDFLLYLPLFI
jgi:hypothetical protein